MTADIPRMVTVPAALLERAYEVARAWNSGKRGGSTNLLSLVADLADDEHELRAALDAAPQDEEAMYWAGYKAGVDAQAGLDRAALDAAPVDEAGDYYAPVKGEKPDSFSLDAVNALTTEYDPKGWLSTLVWNIRNKYLTWPTMKFTSGEMRMVIEGFMAELASRPVADPPDETVGDVVALWDAIDALWAWMPAAQVKEIHADCPGLAELANHAHHRMSHEQRAMRRPLDAAPPDVRTVLIGVLREHRTAGVEVHSKTAVIRIKCACGHSPRLLLRVRPRRLRSPLGRRVGTSARFGGDVMQGFAWGDKVGLTFKADEDGAQAIYEGADYHGVTVHYPCPDGKGRNTVFHPWHAIFSMTLIEKRAG